MRMKNHPQYFISKPRRSSKVGMTIGIDLGDIWSHYCTLNEDGEAMTEAGSAPTRPEYTSASGIWNEPELPWKLAPTRSGSASRSRNLAMR